MRVEIINKAEVKNLFSNFGNVAKVCYATETNKPELIGKSCMSSGHFSGSRGDFIKFQIAGVPRFTIDQAVRHEIGVFKNVQSFRYVNKDCFGYEVPTELSDNAELTDRYQVLMNEINDVYKAINAHVISKGKSKERANEQARYVLPMATTGTFVIGFTLEALIHFMNLRLCTRAEDEIHQMAKLMREETLKILPELETKLVPSCEALLYCPEARGCGRKPSRKKVEELLAAADAHE